MKQLRGSILKAVGRLVMPDSPVYVLVVEDDFLSRLHAVSLVQDAGYIAVEASDADEAITILEARKDIRIVFTDIDMPGSMDGLKLAHAIRERCLWHSASLKQAVSWDLALETFF
jgi:CheY-like chemotaxis protein